MCECVFFSEYILREYNHERLAHNKKCACHLKRHLTISYDCALMRASICVRKIMKAYLLSIDDLTTIPKQKSHCRTKTNQSSRTFVLSIVSVYRFFFVASIFQYCQNSSADELE